LTLYAPACYAPVRPAPGGNLSLSFDHRAFGGAYAARFIGPHQADSQGWRLDAADPRNVNIDVITLDVDKVVT
jgi:hypothetical protein